MFIYITPSKTLVDAVKVETLKLTASQDRATDSEPTEIEGKSVAGLHLDPCKRASYDLAPLCKQLGNWVNA